MTTWRSTLSAVHLQVEEKRHQIMQLASLEKRRKEMRPDVRRIAEQVEDLRAQLSGTVARFVESGNDNCSALGYEGQH